MQIGMGITKKDWMPREFMVAPATLGSDCVTLVWDKPLKYGEVLGYFVYRDGIKLAETSATKTHFTVKGLKPNMNYSFWIESFDKGMHPISSSEIINVKTKVQGRILDVTLAPYLVDSTGSILCTQKLQQAINDCEEGGTVYIPEGAVVLTGALDLKSNMTLLVDGMLKGSLKPEDYAYNKNERYDYKGLVNEDGLILTRYEGWEMYCYRSLINGGYLNPQNRMEVTCENIRICGKGTIYGGGNELGTAMKRLYADAMKYPDYVSDGKPGRRTRGRLLGFIQCKNVHLTEVNIENPPCWTVHMIYCDTVTTNGINIKSRGIDNGDGWDPDSSRNLMIFDTTFDTGDDCIAIKSGKNPDGNLVNMPTENVRIFDLKMLGGHGMAIGSEQSGGVEGIYMRDCVIKNTLFGLELKAHNARGGYIKNLRMLDCEIDRFMAHSVNYNADGTPAPTLPVFCDILIKNTVITGAGRAVELIGFTKDNEVDSTSYVQNVFLEDIVLDNNQSSAEIYLKACRDITFNNVKLCNANSPTYIIDEKCLEVKRDYIGEH